MCTENKHILDCDECGDTFDQRFEGYVGILNSGNRVCFCETCKNDLLFYCEHCGEYEHIDNVVNHNGWRGCATCFSEQYVECESCGDYVENEDAFYIDVNNGDCIVYCEHCYRRHVTRCAECGCEIIRGDEDTIYVESQDSYVCRSCFDADFVACEECGQYIHINYVTSIDGCYYCEGCAEEFRNIKPYSYKPEPIFYTAENETIERELFFGVELEYHCKLPYSPHEAVADFLERSPKNKEIFYFKKDSSLTNGVECVSHPCTLRAWKEHKDLINALFDSVEAGHCYVDANSGLHIHINRRGMSPCHKAKFIAFFNSNIPFCEKIAQRKQSSWSQFKPFKKGSFVKDTAQSSRYEALNWRNSATVELRFFKSTMTPQVFYRAIELAHSAYIFTKLHTSIAKLLLNPEQTFNDFRKFVFENSKLYTNLATFLKG